ncbi:hypothetical protein D3C71_1006750 [compost metagenome]
MAEQLAFHEFSGQRRAVDSDAGFLRPLAPAVNRLGQLAFTGAGFAEYQDIGVGSRDLPRGFEDHFHGRAVGIQAILGFAHLAFEGFQARRQLPHFQLLGRGQAQLIGAARFDQVIGGTGLNGIDGGIHG